MYKLKKAASLPHTQVTTKTLVTDRVGGEDKTVLDEEKETRTPTKDNRSPDGCAIATIRMVDSIKLSQKFQSVGVEVGIEMPFWVRPGEVSDLTQPMALCAELVEQETTERAADLKEFLQKLIRQNQ